MLLQQFLVCGFSAKKKAPAAAITPKSIPGTEQAFCSSYAYFITFKSTL
jgi:hypothetical protein